MRRLFYKGKLEDTIKITGEDAHHLKNVQRAKIGEEITVVDDFNSAARMQIADFGENAAILKLAEKIPLTGECKTKVTLAMAILKGDKTELAIQKATELGVFEVLPLTTKRVVAKLDDKKKADKVLRWQKIADGAAKQSGGLPPKVLPVMALSEFLNSNPKNLIFFYENEGDSTIKDALSRITDDRVILLTGPEGGFALEEAESIIKAGGYPITLGKRILRAETAAILAVALTMHERGDLK